jgi:hypothetical protein
VRRLECRVLAELDRRLQSVSRATSAHSVGTAQ